ncbi:MAG: DUF3261 domain-containing protein [Myxococcota bacterium]
MRRFRWALRRARIGGPALLAALALGLLVGVGSGCGTRPPSGGGGGGGGEADGGGEARPGRTDQAGPTAGEAGPEAEQRKSIEAAALALLPVDAWPGSRLLRQRVEVEWPSGGEGFDAVLQRRPGELALIGLGPMNLVGFRLALVAVGEAVAGEGGSRIEFENRSGRPLPFAPAHILADVQRVFYRWLPEAAISDCPGVCERSGRVGAVAVWERHAAGRLLERRFVIADRLEAGEVRIRYADWQGEPALPRRVELENGWFGYRLAIETLEATPLPEP